MSNSDSNAYEASTGSAKRQTPYLYVRPMSMRKLNMEREGKINFAARMNLVFAVILLVNAAYASYKITRPVPPAVVYVQYFSNAGVIRPVETVSVGMLPGPRPVIARPQVDVNAQRAETPKMTEAPQTPQGTEVAPGALNASPATAQSVQSATAAQAAPSAPSGQTPAAQ